MSMRTKPDHIADDIFTKSGISRSGKSFLASEDPWPRKSGAFGMPGRTADATTHRDTQPSEVRKPPPTGTFNPPRSGSHHP